jgi:Ca2+-binding RTX toxin-like protein
VASGGNQTGSFTYQIDWENDGVFEQTMTGGNSISVPHVYTSDGSHTLAARVTDGSNVSSSVVTFGIAIAVYEIQSDPLFPGQRVLVVGGSTLADVIQIEAGADPNFVDVRINEADNNIRYRFLAEGNVTRLVVFAQAGDDQVTMEKGLLLSGWFHGGLGADKLKGGDGSDVLLGEDGDDSLVGNDGRDLLIGGRGADKLKGNDGDDILIAGYTDYDANDAALLAILNEWNSGRTYEQRVKNLRDGSGTAARSNGNTFLNDTTVRDDGVEDVLTGDAGFDWYLLNTDGDNGSVKDRVTDATASEFQDDVDFWN